MTVFVYEGENVQAVAPPKERGEHGAKISVFTAGAIVVGVFPSLSLEVAAS